MHKHSLCIFGLAEYARLLCRVLSGLGGHQPQPTHHSQARRQPSQPIPHNSPLPVARLKPGADLQVSWMDHVCSVQIGISSEETINFLIGKYQFLLRKNKFPHKKRLTSSEENRSSSVEISGLPVEGSTPYRPPDLNLVSRKISCGKRIIQRLLLWPYLYRPSQNFVQRSI